MNHDSVPSLVDVHVYSFIEDRLHFLLFKRSDSVIYSGEWRMVGGKIAQNESAVGAAKREFTEETGLGMNLFWCVPAVNSFFDFKRNITHHIPVFAVECEAGAKPDLNHEHAESQWFNEAEALEMVLWPEQQRCIRLISRLLAQPELSREWLIPVSPAS